MGAERVPSFPWSNFFSFPVIGIAFDDVDVTLAAIIDSVISSSQLRPFTYSILVISCLIRLCFV